MVQPHIQLDESLGIRYAILPGDPARVSRIAAQLDNPEEITFNREYRSLKGTYKGVPILAMSTGMGGASMAIAVEELKTSASPTSSASAPAEPSRRTSAWGI